MVYVLIKSGAHAEAMGIKYVDGIVGAVIEKKAKPPYKVVGFEQGYTYNPKNIRISPSIKTYVVEVGISDFTVHAISPTIAKLIAKDKLRQGVRFKVFERKTAYRKV